MGVGASNTGNNLVFMVVSALLGLMGISGFFGRRNIHAVDVELEFPAEVFAKIPFPLKIRLVNHKTFLHASLIRVRVEGADTGTEAGADVGAEIEAKAKAGAATLFPFVEAGAGAVKYADFTFPVRGRQSVETVTVSSVFPFNFFTRYRTLKLNVRQEVVVFPTPGKCALAGVFERRSAARGETTSARTGFDAETLSIRPYREGDPLKYISWKATAKTGRLMTREMASSASEPVIIDFEKTGVADVEERLSCIAYAVIKMIGKNVPVGFKMGQRFFKPDTSPRHKTAILTELADMDAGINGRG
jgi:uncharacterized protein (DUF58 family)